MHSFHHSRGRIFFEVLCALALSASFAVAWLQTGASAFLPAAIVAAMYGLWHLTDMRAPRAAAEAGALAPAVEGQGDLLDYLDAAPEPAVEPEPDMAEPVAEAVADVEPTEPEAPPAKARSRAKPSRKKSGSSLSIADEAKIAVAVLPEPAEVETHAPLAPLFEAEPFVRQQRTVFGRKAG